MSHVHPLVLAVAAITIALALSVVIWPAIAMSAKLAYFALGFTAGAAATRTIVVGREHRR